MLSFSNRSEEIEIMDNLDCKGEVVYQTLRELDFINRWLGGNQVTISALKIILESLPIEKEITIVDLGCGSGEMLQLIAKLADQQDRKVKLIGIDANRNIIKYAEEHSTRYENISFQSIDILSEEFKKMSFDIVIATLFFHHFSNDHLINLFSGLRKQFKGGLIVNDIHRHPLAYFSIRWLTTIFSKSKMVQYDAPLSVRRAFKRSDLEIILAKAGIRKYKLRWRWAFRWQLIVLP